MKKKILIIFVVLILCVIAGIIVFLTSGRAGGEIGFDAVINRVEPEYNMAYATVTKQNTGFLVKRLPESIMFNTTDLDVELKAGDEIHGCYLSGTINGQDVRVVSISVEKGAAVTNGTFPEIDSEGISSITLNSSGKTVQITNSDEIAEIKSAIQSIAFEPAGAGESIEAPGAISLTVTLKYQNGSQQEITYPYYLYDGTTYSTDSASITLFGKYFD